MGTTTRTRTEDRGIKEFRICDVLFNQLQSVISIKKNQNLFIIGINRQGNKPKGTEELLMKNNSLLLFLLPLPPISAPLSRGNFFIKTSMLNLFCF